LAFINANRCPASIRTYGEQSGDHAASITDDDAKDMLVGTMKAFFE
jgi:hypothetical protein